MEKKNNGHKNERKMDFFVTITVMDADRIHKIFEMQSSSVDEAMSELMRVNYSKLRQVRGGGNTKMQQQAKLIEELMRRWS